MAKARRKPAHPPDIVRQIAMSIRARRPEPTKELEAPVEWIDNEAQNAGCIVETMRREPGKARRKRRFRLHTLELLGKTRRLSETQVLAGLALHERWCMTQLSPPAVQEIYVDAPVRPDEVAVAQVEAMQAYADMIALVPLAYRATVRRVACDGHWPTTEVEIVALQQGLTGLARARGY